MTGETYNNMYDFNSRLGNSAFFGGINPKLNTKTDLANNNTFQSYLMSAENKGESIVKKQDSEAKSRVVALNEGVQARDEKYNGIALTKNNKASSYRTENLKNAGKLVNNDDMDERVKTTTDISDIETDTNINKGLTSKKESNSVIVDEASKESTDNLELDELSDVLGITSNQLLTLFEYMNVELETSDDGTINNIEQALDGLLNELGFDKAAKESLVNVVNTIMNKQEELTKPIIEESSSLMKEIESLINSKKATEKSQIVNAELEAFDSESITPQQLFEQLKQEIKSIMNQISEQNKSLAEALSEQNNTDAESGADAEAAIIASKELSKPVVASVNQQEAVNPNAEVDKNVSEHSEQNQGDDSNDRPDTDIQAVPKASVKHVAQEAGAKANNNFESIIQGVQTNTSASSEIEKMNINTAKETFVTKEEVMNQIVDKAKLMVGDNKSEMVMELKPEALGKLTLKIVTERGEVMAKFFADNYQVKAVLESNMQLLKDSLQKQGVNIQGLSVSVNSQKQESQSNNQNKDKKEKLSINKQSKKANKNILIRENLSVYDKAPDRTDAIGSKYQYNGSINLTA